MAADPKPRLRCDKCGTRNVGDLAIVAKLGGTHFQMHAGIRGRNSEFFKRATTCGTWVADEEARGA